MSFAFVASILLGALPAFAVPRLAVPPEGVVFGEIAAAEVASKSIELCNVSSSPVAVSQVKGCCGADAALSSMCIEPSSAAMLLVSLKPMQLAFMANFNLWHKVAAKTHPAEKYVKAIFDSGQTLFDAICNSNFLISTIKENSPDDKGKRRNPRKGSGLKGRRTRAMANWLDRFEEYVKTGNPIDEKYKEKTVGARANQFWNNNRQSLEAAKNAEGESRGFSSPKTLADAYRKR